MRQCGCKGAEKVKNGIKRAPRKQDRKGKDKESKRKKERGTGATPLMPEEMRKTKAMQGQGTPARVTKAKDRNQGREEGGTQTQKMPTSVSSSMG